MGGYISLTEYLDGLRRVVRARQAVNERIFGTGDPDCGAKPMPTLGGDTEDSRLDILKLELHDAADEHHYRAERTSREGIVLPLDELAAEHELTAPERRLVEALLVEMTDLGRDRAEPVCLGTFARYLGDWDPVATQACFDLVLPGSKLVKNGLVCVRRGPVAGRWSAHLSRQAFEQLLAGGAAPVTQAPEPGREPAADIRAFLDERGVVLEPAALDALDLLWAEARYGSRVLGEWGFGTAAGSGSTVALFHGPSGTGKTLTARALAAALGLDLHVVSYAEVFNEYVGQTEKAIVRMFAEAKKKNAVLLLDEADALLGQRGDIARAVDRHFNSEVNTALMELERHTGVVVLTTNHTGLLDPALERRIRHKVLFAAPGAEARSRIWRSRIPATAPLAADVDFTALGEEFELTGGQIANAALVAAFSAVRRSGKEDAGITQAELRAAAQREVGGYGGAKAKAVGF
ncbi:MAG: ATP-binding protein [bacterium]